MDSIADEAAYRTGLASIGIHDGAFDVDFSRELWARDRAARRLQVHAASPAAGGEVAVEENRLRGAMAKLLQLYIGYFWNVITIGFIRDGL